MTKERDDLRPRGKVEVECQHPGCGWSFWLDPLDPRLPDGPFLCDEHDGSGDHLREMPKAEPWTN